MESSYAARTEPSRSQSEPRESFVFVSYTALILIFSMARGPRYATSYLVAMPLSISRSHSTNIPYHMASICAKRKISFSSGPLWLISRDVTVKYKCSCELGMYHWCCTLNPRMCAIWACYQLPFNHKILPNGVFMSMIHFLWPANFSFDSTISKLSSTSL